MKKRPKVLEIFTKKTNNTNGYACFKMMITGELVKDKIIVSKSKEVGRLYNKSKFGKMLAGNKLELNLIEGLYLIDEKKIKIFDNKKGVSFQILFEKAAKKISNLEIKYPVFKDLRNRGHVVELYDKIKDVSFCQIVSKKEKPEFLVSVFSEKDIFDIKKTANLIKDSSKICNKIWIAIVDDEGDITYYEVSFLDIKGRNKEGVYKKSDAVLLGDKVIIFDKKQAKSLFEKEFYGKPVNDGLQISLVETIHLQNKGSIDVRTVKGEKINKKSLRQIAEKNQSDFDMRILVFKDLKKRGLIVKTGFKFGTHFRAYTKSPDETHAEFLAHVVSKDFKSVWSEMSRAIRLAHSVNKEIVFAKTDKNAVDYIKFGRLRP
jgi:tRNA-intron endonuclease